MVEFFPSRSWFSCGICHATNLSTELYRLATSACLISFPTLSPHLTLSYNLNLTSEFKSLPLCTFAMVLQTETLIFSFPQSDLNSHSKNIPAVISAPASIPRNVQTEISYYTPPEDGRPQLPIYMKDEKKLSDQKS